LTDAKPEPAAVTGDADDADAEQRERRRFRNDLPFFVPLLSQ